MTYRVGLWIIGAYGGVGSTTALGLAAMAKGLTETNGLVTALPEFAAADWDKVEKFVVGGHDVRAGSFSKSAHELHERSNVFTHRLLSECGPTLAEWSENVRPGVGNTPATLIDNNFWWNEQDSAEDILDAIMGDIDDFRLRHHLNDVVVINAASTEPVFDRKQIPHKAEKCELAMLAEELILPTSSLYAWAAVRLGCPYVNLTPSLGGSFPAFEEHCLKHKVPHAGQDLKTGETLLKSVLAPMFAMRNLRVLSWVGHNILGNRDGQVLADPANKASKLKTKDAILAELLGYQPQTHTSIEYIESLDDWKTAWDHIHFEGFLGTKMTMQFTWQGCDSILAAPLVIDLARLLLLAHRRGHTGVLPAAACFFKSPLGTPTQSLMTQFEMLKTYVAAR